MKDYQPLWPHPPSSILYWDVDNKWNNDIEWAMFFTCHTLRDARWKYPLNDSPRAHAIYGYRERSDELTDDEIITRFFDYVPNYTLFDSYRWANQDNGELDWAIIGHLNNKGDYLHGVKTGATADCSDSTDMYRWYYGGAVKLDSDVAYKQPKKQTLLAKLMQKLSSLPLLDLIYPKESYASLGFSRPGFEVVKELPVDTPAITPLKLEQESISESTLEQWFGTLPAPEEKDGVKTYISANETVKVFPSGAVMYRRGSSSRPINKSEQEAKQIAEEFVARHGGLPQDAKLVASGKTIQEHIDSGEKEVLAYTFTYGRDSNGIPVSYSGDSIVVEVTEDGVTAFSKLWRKIVGEAGTTRQVKSSNDVLVPLHKFSTPTLSGISHHISRYALLYNQA